MWVKPKDKNNWGHVTTYYGDVRRESDGAYAEVVKGPHRVRWPDGSEEDVEVTLKMHTETVSDHGVQHRVSSLIPMVEIDHRGARFRVRLVDAGCDVFVDQARIERAFAVIDTRNRANARYSRRRIG